MVVVSALFCFVFRSDNILESFCVLPGATKGLATVMGTITRDWGNMVRRVGTFC